jgi:uncharacterized DUF497 family protein
MYTWDEVKNRLNKEKHGFYFSEIVEVFEDPHLIEWYDKTHSTQEEDRYICLGSLRGVIILYVVIAPEGEDVQIITARRAEPLEERTYYEHYQEETGGNQSV